MAFNAGGTNVGGVQQRDAGILIQTNFLDTSITADGTYDSDYTVPAGKVWLLKWVRAKKTNGTYTKTNQVNLINPAGYEISIVDATSSDITQSASSWNIFIPAGWKIRFRYIITGFSLDGICQDKLLYQEITI